MDDLRFDRLARAVSAVRSRRQVVALLGAALLAGRRSAGVGAAAAQDAATPACGPGLTACAGGCVDVQSDLANCGACGAVCESGLVPVRCRNGVCERASCPVGIEYCGAVDGCRDLATDPNHCGACQNACASGVCSGGVCGTGGGAGCAAGQTDCGGVCVETCCDNANCGACGNACGDGETCFEGVCDCPSGLCCPAGEVLCGDDCVATCCDNANCGACGVVCQGGYTCFEGACDCPSGLPEVCCPGGGVPCADGCVETCCDNNNCGACGNVCPQGLTCFEGVCDCPSGNCPPPKSPPPTPPIKLPNTGAGPNVGTAGGPWVPAVLAGVAAAVVAGWRRVVRDDGG